MKTYYQLVKRITTIVRYVGMLKYLLVPSILVGQLPTTHCAKDDYPSVGNVSYEGPNHDLEGKTLSYSYWVVPVTKVHDLGNSFLVMHPKYQDECNEEQSTLSDLSIKTALKDGRKILISLTIRDGIPDKDWRFVMMY